MGKGIYPSRMPMLRIDNKYFGENGLFSWHSLCHNAGTHICEHCWQNGCEKSNYGNGSMSQMYR